MRICLMVNVEQEKKQLRSFLPNFFFALIPKILFHVKHAIPVDE